MSLITNALSGVIAAAEAYRDQQAMPDDNNATRDASIQLAKDVLEHLLMTDELAAARQAMADAWRSGDLNVLNDGVHAGALRAALDEDAR